MAGPLLLLTVPLALLVVPGLLAVSAFLERSVLSPRAMIRTVARSRRSAPEFAEQFVAREFERMLREAQDRPG